MEVDTTEPPSGSGSSSVTYPRWVTLERFCRSNVDDPSFLAAVPKSLAAARTSHGHLIQVSLSLAEPPSTSAVLIEFPGGGNHVNYSIIMAAHRDSLLVSVEYKRYGTQDYFVYSAGDAAADPPRPPSLLLLPRYYPSESDCSRRYQGLGSDPGIRELNNDSTGFIILHPRRGEDEVVVAELMLVGAVREEDAPKPMAAELLLFRSGEWSVKRPRICCGDDGDDEHGELPSEWEITSIFPVGDRTLCWVDVNGVLICDVLEESPYLQYVPLPSVPTNRFGWNVWATADGRTLKFVNIFPRCCCGGAGATDCQRSHHAYTINTWTLRMDDSMVWVMDGMVDATELWSLDTYKGLPRAPLAYPIVSMYESHIMCFALWKRYYVEFKYSGDETLWLLMVDMRNKTIQSVSRHSECFLVSSNVSNYLNPYPPCSSDDGMSMSMDESVDIMKKKRDDAGTNSIVDSPCKFSAQPAAQAYNEILAAFREIPSYGLASDDMLKAYATLSSDNGCRVRSLLRLPMKLRKDWLLMEIKGDDA